MGLMVVYPILYSYIVYQKVLKKGDSKEESGSVK